MEPFDEPPDLLYERISEGERTFHDSLMSSGYGIGLYQAEKSQTSTMDEPESLIQRLAPTQDSYLFYNCKYY